MADEPDPDEDLTSTTPENNLSKSDSDENHERIENDLAQKDPNPIKAAREILENVGKTGLKNMAVQGMGDSNEMKVLDPEHPLMVSFQKSMKEHLLKMHQETDNQMFEMKGALQDQVKENDKIGKHISILQKELLKAKNGLQKTKKSHAGLHQKKQKISGKLEEVRSVHKSMNERLNHEKKNDGKLQKEMEELSLQIVQLSALQAESYADASTVAHATEQTSKQKRLLEIEKLRQDMLINRLETDQHSLQDKIKLYKSQCVIKREELTDLRKVLLDAVSYIQSMHYEKLHLMQQWNYSILSLEKRDQTCATLHDSIRAQENDMITLKMDLVNHKKSVRKELEENEKLILRLLHIKSDVTQIERNIENGRTRLRALEEQYAFFDNLVTQTDEELTKLKHESEALSREIDAKTKILEKAYETRRKLDAEYMRILQEKMTITKTSQATENLIKRNRKKIQELEEKCILKEGEKAQLHIKLADSESHLLALEETLSNLTKEYDEKMKTILKSESEIVKGHATIEKKQQELAELNIRLGELLESSGGVELGPLEREIANIKKEIKVVEKNRKVMEQEWLRFQKELVLLTDETNAKLKETEVLRRKEAVLEERKIRIEMDLNREEKEITEILRSITRTQNDLERLNAMLYHEKDVEQHLQQDGEMLKSDFLNAMKEAELGFIKKESELESLRRKRMRALCKLAEKQREATLWEEKLKIVEETKKILRSESHADELSHLRGEIRRLQVKLDHIRRDMEAIIQLMEKTALRHASLYIQADIIDLRGAKKKSKLYFKTKSERLKRRINDEQKKLEKFKEELKLMNNTMFQLNQEEEDKKSSISHMTTELNDIKKEFESIVREKWRNVIRLSFKQKKNKLLQKVKDEKYVCATRNPQQRSSELQNIHGSISLLSNLIDDILAVHPNLRDKLVKVTDHIIVGLQM